MCETDNKRYPMSFGSVLSLRLPNYYNVTRNLNLPVPNIHFFFVVVYNVKLYNLYDLRAYVKLISQIF